MLELKFIKENIDLIKDTILKKRIDLDFDSFLNLDKKRRDLITIIDQKKHERNVVTEEISILKKQRENVDQLILSMRNLSEEIKQLDIEFKNIEEEFKKILLWFPNIIDSSVPLGKNAEDNVVIKEWGEKKNFNFEPLTYWQLEEKHNLVDFNCGSKIAGANFPVYKGIGARLERAFINFMLDLHTKKHKYIEIFPPFLANKKSMIGTGQLPKLEEDMYQCKDDDLFAIPTAEVPLTNLHQDDILNEEKLPIYYTAYSACFRREAGSYGKDTRGLMRVHQFNKVELVKFVLPETSFVELETLLQNAEEVLQLLNIPYRIISLCTGELSFASTKTYDIEVWTPATKKYLEVSSCSNFIDFQSRRSNIRLKRKNRNFLEYVHTLNGSGLATPRTFIAFVENYQQKDGSIFIPEILRPYMDGMEKIG